jgi:hypothetical protein
VESWIRFADSQSPVVLNWIREAPALGLQARQLKHDVTEAYIKLIQGFSDTQALRATGHTRVLRHRALTFIGGLREMAASAIEADERLSDRVEEAVDSALALFQ